MDPRIVLTTNVASLTPAQEKVLNQLVKSAGPDLLQLQVFSNVDTSDEDALPVGVAMIMRADAAVDPTLLSDSLFETLTLNPVRGGGGDFSTLAVNSSVEGQRADGSVVGRDLREAKVWENELGSQGAFVGAYATLRADHVTHDYYIAARGTAPQLIRDLKRGKTAGITYAQLVDAPIWINARYMAGRNVKRNVAQAAASCGVAIDRDLDRGACVAHPSHAQPEMALPTHVQTSHSVQKTIFEGKQAAVVLANGVIVGEGIEQVIIAGPVNLFSFQVTRPKVAVPATTCSTTLDKAFKAEMKALGCKRGQVLVQRKVQEFKVK